ncbi:MAG: ferritin-like domain-containing protein [Nitrososphaerales archaeon]
MLVDELQDLYHAENQLVKALPKMSEAAHDTKLKQSFKKHLEQTQGHVKRLEEAFQMLGENAKAKPCKGMMGLVSEGEETIEEGKELEPVAADLALIAASQKVEHYEISGYGTVKTMAEKMGKDKVAELLEQTQSEEKKTDELLTEAAKPMLEQLSEA